MKMRLMRYTGNANDNDATGALTFEGRPDVKMHGIGEMTDVEIAALSAIGMVLEQVDDGGLDDKNVKELLALATKEYPEASVEDGDKKPEIISKIRVAMANSGAEQAAYAVGGTGIAASGGPTGTPVGGTTSAGGASTGAGNSSGATS